MTKGLGVSPMCPQASCVASGAPPASLGIALSGCDVGVGPDAQHSSLGPRFSKMT